MRANKAKPETPEKATKATTRAPYIPIKEKKATPGTPEKATKAKSRAPYTPMRKKKATLDIPMKATKAKTSKPRSPMKATQAKTSKPSSVIKAKKTKQTAKNTIPPTMGCWNAVSAMGCSMRTFRNATCACVQCVATAPLGIVSVYVASVELWSLKVLRAVKQSCLRTKVVRTKLVVKHSILRRVT